MVSCLRRQTFTSVSYTHLKEENQFKLTRADLEAHLSPKSKVLILPFPNNPTGAIMTKEDLADIVDLIIENDLIVMTDEIYEMCIRDSI